MGADLLTTVDTMILGRILYQGFQQAWPAVATTPSMPKELIDFAHWIEDSPKYVFSRSLDSLDWENSFLLKGSIVDEVKKLKQQPGKDIVIFGGAGIVQQFAAENLIDEYRIKLEPVFLGSGKPLFKDLTKLKLVHSKVFSSGVIGLYYQPQ
jgi:dihydrofolate reductase